MLFKVAVVCVHGTLGISIIWIYLRWSQIPVVVNLWWLGPFPRLGSECKFEEDAVTLARSENIWKQSIDFHTLKTIYDRIVSLEAFGRRL